VRFNLSSKNIYKIKDPQYLHFYWKEDDKEISEKNFFIVASRLHPSAPLWSHNRKDLKEVLDNIQLFRIVVQLQLEGAEISKENIIELVSADAREMLANMESNKDILATMYGLEACAEMVLARPLLLHSDLQPLISLVESFKNWYKPVFLWLNFSISDTGRPKK
jgi:hypothetical protein